MRKVHFYLLDNTILVDKTSNNNDKLCREKLTTRFSRIAQTKGLWFSALMYELY